MCIRDRYNIGTYGTNRDGIDGKMGAKTAKAIREIAVEYPEVFADYINIENIDDLPRPVGRPSNRRNLKKSGSVYNLNDYR